MLKKYLIQFLTSLLSAVLALFVGFLVYALLSLVFSYLVIGYVPHLYSLAALLLCLWLVSYTNTFSDLVCIRFWDKLNVRPKLADNSISPQHSEDDDTRDFASLHQRGFISFIIASFFAIAVAGSEYEYYQIEWTDETYLNASRMLALLMLLVLGRALYDRNWVSVFSSITIVPAAYAFTVVFIMHS